MTEKIAQTKAARRKEYFVPRTDRQKAQESIAAALAAAVIILGALFVMWYYTIIVGIDTLGAK